MFDWTKDPHRRFNPLTREWVLVSPHRTDRPWQGQMEAGAVDAQPDYDPDCYLCPGNARAGGIQLLVSNSRSNPGAFHAVASQQVSSLLWFCGADS